MSGSSIGTVLGGVIGGLLGFFVPVVGTAIGFAIGSTLGGAIGGFVDPPKQPKIEGPRLQDLSVQTSAYGAFIPRAYGLIAVYGNIFWLENNKIKETAKKTRQGGKGMGGGGATTKTYTYSATFALGLCEGPIAGIGRIWIGDKLFFDSNSINSIYNSQYFTIYKGTDTQDSNPRMQATLGAANVPAYRGLAYLVFYDLPLKDYGNSIQSAQIKVEVIKTATVTGARLYDSTDIVNYPYDFYPSQIRSSASGLLSFYSYPPFDTSITVQNGENVASNEVYQLITGSGDYVGTKSISSDDGVIRTRFISSGFASTKVGIFDNDWVWWSETNDPSTIGGISILIPWGDVTRVNPNTEVFVASRGDISTALSGETGRYIKGLAISIDQTQIIIFTYHLGNAISKQADRYFILDTDLNLIKSGSIAGSPDKIFYNYGFANSDEKGGLVFLSGINKGWSAYVDGNFKVKYWEIDDSDILQISGELISDTTINDDLSTAYSYGVFYVLMHKRSSSLARLYRFTAVESTPTLYPTLGDIVEAESLNSKFLKVADIDTTELTDIVRGFRVSGLAAIRAGIDPLRSAWPFDAIQSGYQIKFKRRGSASVATIDSDLLDAHSANDGQGVTVIESREMDSVLSRRVTLKYFDYVREYDINEQYVERINTDAVNDLIMDLPIVLNATEAAQKAEVLLYLYWMERHDLIFRLPPVYSALEPSDVITITAENATYEARLTAIDYTADGRLECKAKYNKAALYTASVVGEEGQSTGVTLSVSGPSTYVLLDIPMIQDVYNSPGFPAAMTGYLADWEGGVIYQSRDNGLVWDDIQGFTSPGSTIGYASTTIAVHDGLTLDKKSLLTIRLYQGTLSSVTEQQMFNGSNWFAYGLDGRWEIIACQNAVLQGGGSYILSDFLRGQFGTEWSTGLHVANDSIVLLNSDDLSFIEMDSGDIGVSYLYRGITTGALIDSDVDLSFSYDAVNLECLSPCQPTGSRHPTTNDWTIIWTRRTRFAGWRSYIDAELGEDIESYEIDVFSSAAFTTIKRTLTSVTQTVQYTSAQQVTDFGSNQSTIRVKIYQMSALVGRGYALTATLVR
jgi:hypothetical protein